MSIIQGKERNNAVRYSCFIPEIRSRKSQGNEILAERRDRMEAALCDNEEFREEIMELNEIYLGDAYELIKGVRTGSVDLIVTDP